MEPLAFNKDSAHPLSRYDGWHDINRVERACTQGASCGYAVFLTNDTLYWRSEAVGGSRPFSLHMGRVVKAGKLAFRVPKRRDVKRTEFHLALHPGRMTASAIKLAARGAPTPIGSQGNP
jgi:hypothetical protein